MKKYQSIINSIIEIAEKPSYSFLITEKVTNWPLWTHWWPLTKESMDKIISDSLIKRVAIRWDGNRINLQS